MGRPLAGAGRTARRTDVSSLFVVSSAGAILSSACGPAQRRAERADSADNFGSTESGFNGDAAPAAVRRGIRLTVNDRTTVFLFEEHRRPRRRRPGSAGGAARQRAAGLLTTTPRRPPRRSSSTTAAAGCCSPDMGTLEADGSVSVLGRARSASHRGREGVPGGGRGGAEVAPGSSTRSRQVPDERFGNRVAASSSRARRAPSAQDGELEEYCRRQTVRVQGAAAAGAGCRISAVHRAANRLPWAKEAGHRSIPARTVRRGSQQKRLRLGNQLTIRRPDHWTFADTVNLR